MELKQFLSPAATSPVLAMVLGLALPPMAVAGPLQVRMQSHSAIYELKLESSTEDSFGNYEGILAFKLQGSDCEGYTYELESYDRVGSVTGQQSTSQSSIQYFEDGSGNLFRSSGSKTDLSSAPEKFDTLITKLEDGSALVEISAPKSQSFDIARKLTFPIEWIKQLVESALAGENKYVSFYYDGGTSPDELYYVFTSIGIETTENRSENPILVEAGLSEGVRSWKTTSSYYTLKFGEDESVLGEREPDFIIEQEIFENGLGADVLYHYGETIISGELTEVKKIETKSCS